MVIYHLWQIFYDFLTETALEIKSQSFNVSLKMASVYFNTCTKDYTQSNSCLPFKSKILITSKVIIFIQYSKEGSGKISTSSRDFSYSEITNNIVSFKCIKIDFLFFKQPTLQTFQIYLKICLLTHQRCTIIEHLLTYILSQNLLKF